MPATNNGARHLSCRHVQSGQNRLTPETTPYLTVCGDVHITNGVMTMIRHVSNQSLSIQGMAVRANRKVTVQTVRRKGVMKQERVFHVF